MKTVIHWTGAVLALAVLPALAQQQDFSKVEVKVHKVAGSIYMLEGAGGNIGVSVGDDGIVIVDDQYAPLADKIKAALASIADKPLRFLINTHYHGDHTGSNAVFGKTTQIVAHDNVRKRLMSGGPMGNGGSVRMDSPRAATAALPIITFERDVTLHVNGEDIRALHYPNGHTDTDSIVFFPKSNVVHMGDDFVTYGFPFIDIVGGGTAKGMIDACEGVIKALPPDVKVIPGHGPVSSLDDVRRFVTMLKDTSGAVRKALEAGKTLDQMKTGKVLEPWAKFSGPFVNTDAFIETLYNDLTRKK